MILKDMQKKGEKGKTVETNNIKPWNQNAYPQAYNIRLKNGGNTMAEAGCGYFSLNKTFNSSFVKFSLLSTLIVKILKSAFSLSNNFSKEKLLLLFTYIHL